MCEICAPLHGRVGLDQLLFPRGRAWFPASLCPGILYAFSLSPPPSFPPSLHCSRLTSINTYIKEPEGGGHVLWSCLRRAGFAQLTSGLQRGCLPSATCVCLPKHLVDSNREQTSPPTPPPPHPPPFPQFSLPWIHKPINGPDGFAKLIFFSYADSCQH